VKKGDTAIHESLHPYGYRKDVTIVSVGKVWITASNRKRYHARKTSAGYYTMENVPDSVLWPSQEARAAYLAKRERMHWMDETRTALRKKLDELTMEHLIAINKIAELGMKEPPP